MRHSSVIFLLLTIIAVPASATWSIVAADSETQEIVVASATCVAGLDLRAVLPVIVVGKGGGAAQSYGDTSGTRRVMIWNDLQAGQTAPQIIDNLTALAGIDNFQHGVAEVFLGSSATQTGATNFAHASGVTGSFGTVSYAIQGNILTGSPVIAMAEAAFTSTIGDLPAKAMAAMEAARSMGGDGRCSCSPSNATSCGSPPPSFDKAAHIGFLLVARYGDTDDASCTSAGCADGDYFMNINVASQGASDADPVFQIQALFDAARQDLLGRPDAIASTVSITGVQGSADDWLMRVELIDWQGTPLSQGVLTFGVEHAPESDQVTTIGSVVNNGDGSYELTLTETGQEGVDVFLITADDGIRAVVLPPRRAILNLVPLFVDGFENGSTSEWTAVVP